MARNDRLQSSAFMLGGVLVASFAGTGAQAQEEQEELDRTPESCVVVDRVDRDVAISDRSIVFFMRGTVVFLNEMPGSCPTLQRGETRLTYNYKTTTARLTRLCDTDSITVDRPEGVGVSCGLGKFHPITETEAETFINDPAAAAAALSVPQQSTAAAEPQGQAQITTVIEVPTPSSPQCVANLNTGYFQANTLARVEGTIKIEGCAAATGKYTVAARIRDASGETKTLEFAETFSRADAQDLTFKDEYPIGENVELVSVRTRGLSCECADQPAQ